MGNKIEDHCADRVNAKISSKKTRKAEKINLMEKKGKRKKIVLKEWSEKKTRKIDVKEALFPIYAGFGIKTKKKFPK